MVKVVSLRTMIMDMFLMSMIAVVAFLFPVGKKQNTKDNGAHSTNNCSDFSKEDIEGKHFRVIGI
jgi:hypothetical protein